MIPENLWTLVKRWYWLIGAFALAGALAGVLLIPQISGASSEFHASVTIGIRRVISPAGSTTGGATSADFDLLADYTTSVATRAKTPQFIAKLHDRLVLGGVDTPEIYLRDKYKVTDDRGLSRITIDSTAGSEAMAQAIASTVSDLLIEEVEDEESRLRENLSATMENERSELLADLGEITSARLARLDALGDDSLQETIDNVVRRGIGTNLPEEARSILEDLERISGDPELAVLASRERAIQEELANLASVEQNLATDIRGDPVVVLNPVATAQDVTPGTRLRDAGVLGLLAGAVLGWIAANIAEANNLHVRIPRRSRKLVRDQRKDEWVPDSPREEFLS
jgi:hypothetical protein